MKVGIFFGAPLETGWGRAQNLARAFVQSGHEVYYLEAIRPFRFSAFLRPLKIRRINDRLNQLIPQFGLPYVRFPASRKLHFIIQSLQLKHFLSRVPPLDLGIMYGVPTPEILRYIKASCAAVKWIYDCADAKEETFNDLKGKDQGKMVADWEKVLLKNVDGMTAINTHLLESRWQGGASRCLAVDNGVDPELFKFTARPYAGRGPVKIVYAGAINERLDIEQLAGVLAHEGVRIQVDFFGKYHDVLTRLNSFENFRYRGEVPYERLPENLSGYHFGLLPYRNIDSINFSSPLKIWQYLSLGMPVLSFPYDNLPVIPGYIFDFSKGLPRDSLTYPGQFKEVLQGKTWVEAVRKILKFVQELHVNGRLFPENSGVTPGRVPV